MAAWRATSIEPKKTSTTLLQEVKSSMEATVAATCALRFNTNDRAKNERDHLESACKILNE